MESDIELVMSTFKVDAKHAAGMIERGLKPSVLRNGYNILGSKLHSISKKADKVVENLTDEITKVTDELNDAKQSTQSDN